MLLNAAFDCTAAVTVTAVAAVAVVAVDVNIPNDGDDLWIVEAFDDDGIGDDDDDDINGGFVNDDILVEVGCIFIPSLLSTSKSVDIIVLFLTALGPLSELSDPCIKANLFFNKSWFILVALLVVGIVVVEVVVVVVVVVAIAVVVDDSDDNTTAFVDGVVMFAVVKELEEAVKDNIDGFGCDCIFKVVALAVVAVACKLFNFSKVFIDGWFDDK